MIKFLVGTVIVSLLLNTVPIAVAETPVEIETPEQAIESQKEQTSTESEQVTESQEDLSAARLYVLAQEEFAKLNYPAAIELLKKGLLINKDENIEELMKLSLFIIYKVGGNSTVKGRPQVAIERFTEAIKLQPNDYFLYARRGDAYFELGQVQQSIREHTKSIQLNPSKGNGYSRRGLIYMGAKDYRSAYLDYKTSRDLYLEAGNRKGAEDSQFVMDVLTNAGFNPEPSSR